MRIRWTCLLLVWVLGLSGAHAQYDVPADIVQITGSSAHTWRSENTTVIQMEGPVGIDIDNTRLSAQQAVIWVTPVPGAVAGLKYVEIALVGGARVQRPDGVVLEGRRLFVDARARGVIRISAPRRANIDQSDSELYKEASALRPVVLKPGAATDQRWVVVEQPPLTTQPATQPTGQFRPLRPVTLRGKEFSTVKTPQGKVAAVLGGGVRLFQRTETGDFIELLAERAVAFTPYSNLAEFSGAQITSAPQVVTGAYLEGDVRIIRTPADKIEPEQRLSAERAFYDFTTDRAVLTDVVLHTVDPNTAIPIVVRAETVRQLSEREYTTEKAKISTSSFHTPSFSIGASSTYMRTVESENEALGARTHFRAKDARFDLWGFPVFYTPVIAGSVTERNLLRRIESTNSSGFGFGLSTQWGLFETFGRLPPRGADASYSIDYFSDRGPALGLDFEYNGGFIEPATLDPWSYRGDFTSYLVVNDSGKDDLGRRRLDVDPEKETRGRFYWQHQHFFPGDWQVQIAGGYISDPTFMEEWFNRDFRNSAPLQTAFYAKRQRDSEAFTFLASVQPNDFVTVADLYQEQFEVERLPEIGYRRVGDSLFDDTMTFYSANSISALRFNNSDANLEDLGFPAARIEGQSYPGRLSPGLPSLGQTGSPSDTNYRGDFRQELNWPLSVYRFRMVPYVIGRYTQYSESVDGSAAERLYMGGGVRLTTAFWKIDDTVKSNFWDLHRLRHVIEPEINAFTSVQSTDRNDLLIYDEPIDAITDISAVQLGLNQRWQTKRGGPGNWRSVDFLTLNVAYNHFLSQPPDRELAPLDFRGLYFVSMPEASLPRNAVNAYAAWRLSDSVQLTGEANYNTEETLLATAAIGLSVKQDTRLSYFLGLRHIGVDFIEEIPEDRSTFLKPTGPTDTFVFDDQDLFIAAASYQLTAKYRLQLANAYDLAHNRNNRSTISLIRRFDRFFVELSARVDQIQGENAFFFNVWPQGLQPGGGSQAVNGVFQN